MIRKIRINPNWLYHQVQFEKLPNILKNNAILSKRRQGDNTITSNAWNGLDYISLSKKDKNYIWNSSYRRFISSSYAFIFDEIEAIETEIDEFLNIIDGKMQVPFIDIDNELQIDKKDIKKYLLER